MKIVKIIVGVFFVMQMQTVFSDEFVSDLKKINGAWYMSDGKIMGSFIKHKFDWFEYCLYIKEDKAMIFLPKKDRKKPFIVMDVKKSGSDTFELIYNGKERTFKVRHSALNLKDAVNDYLYFDDSAPYTEKNDYYGNRDGDYYGSLYKNDVDVVLDEIEMNMNTDDRPTGD